MSRVDRLFETVGFPYFDADGDGRIARRYVDGQGAGAAPSGRKRIPHASQPGGRCRLNLRRRQRQVSSDANESTGAGHSDPTPGTSRPDALQLACRGAVVAQDGASLRTGRADP
jgi:hypothetical protein